MVSLFSFLKTVPPFVLKEVSLACVVKLLDILIEIFMKSLLLYSEDCC